MQNFRNNVSFYNRENSCGCGNRPDNNRPADRFPEPPCYQMDPLGSMPLAMAYVPWQRWQNLFEADKGYHCGTIFQELRKPFDHAGGGCR